MKCPTCVSEGKKSIVRVGMSSTTCAYYRPFYDEDGKFHHHDGNITSTELNCTNGHSWVDKSTGSCWCGWEGKAV